MGYKFHFDHGLEDEEYDRTMSDRALLARLASFILVYRRRFVICFALVLGGAVLGVIQPMLLRTAIDSYMMPASQGKIAVNAAFQGLVLIASAYLAIAVVSYFGDVGRVYLLNWIGSSLMRDIRNSMFGHLQRMSKSFFDKSEVGRLMSKVTSDVETIYEVLATGLLNVFSDFIKLGLIISVMLIVNVRLTIYALLTVPMLLGMAVLFRGMARRAYRRTRQKIAGVMANLQESISGVKVAQSFSREERNAQRFDQANVENLQANLYAAQVHSVFFPAVELLGAIGLTIVYFFGGQSVIGGAISLGTLILFQAYVMQFFGPIMDLTQFYNSLQSAFAAAERIFGVLDTPSEVVDQPGAVDMGRVRGIVDFRDVTFEYVPGHPVLGDLNMHVDAGERLAIVGPTGAGKSTIMNLLLRYYDVTRGSICIDGTDIRCITLDSLRRNMAIVLQDTILFSGTIKDNIRYGKPDASDEEVQAAARAVGAAEFISRLPQGYDTAVRERGGNLSVGQRQLIAFARALLVDPPILLLDEATSSVDPYTELLIQNALEQLLRNRTSVVIAHRLSTVRNSDRIVVLDDGRIVEEGRHQQLMAKGGLYRNLCEMQFMTGKDEPP